LKSKALSPEFLDMLKERIQINEQIQRYSKLMQQAYLVARGKVKIDKMQAEAARTFMLGFKTSIGRFVPELKAIEHTGEIGYRDVTELSDEELQAIAAGSRGGTAETTPRTLQ
jgi:hypothetical protein